jgi:2-polyprenyl-3-methyl-5-hydroxy-6-metoxy-1,4-benzoquinol methylase
MKRQLEPELMDSPAEAIAYDQMDHAEVNRRFVDDLLAALGFVERRLSVIDLGAGTAQIPIELCRRDARFHVTAIDAAASMLDVARANVRAAGSGAQIDIELADAKRVVAGNFDVVMSNSLVHHLPEPREFFASAVGCAAPTGLLFVRDLFRPADEHAWRQLVEAYAGDEPPAARQMFGDSLRAALTVDEVQQYVTALGFDAATVAATSDRHWTWCCACSRT